MTFKVVVAGAGHNAAGHVKAMKELPERLRLAAVADIRTDRAEGLAGATAGMNAYADYREMVLREKPDIAVITLPHHLHKEAAVFCAEAGCHVLLEKPMALTVEQCDEMMAAVRRSNVRLMVGHTQHFIAENMLAKKIIADEAYRLGKLVMMNDTRHTAYYTAERPAWFLDKQRSGGGILFNLGSHSVDRIMWLGSAKIAKVRALMSHYGSVGDVEGSGVVFLENESGVPSTLAQSGYGGVQRNELELVFTEAMMKIVPGQGVWISRNGRYEQIPVPREAAPFVLQYRELLASIEQEREPDCSMAYSRDIIAVLEGIYRSHELKSEVAISYGGA
ncbi:Gfo/Idh/MocA family protein [Paenibacillus allorhizosphaerae]|uniref:Inositol 2-dehydrogenase/D-chiro-inositol 3-dehydrogenase n=1 Tax=Paenibacillus allorhizosphaerae TaxID=2849866 RepID=A0ABN7TJD7_9BACL|nr:Gfo/Idh/MocA family oxidoreductase [Paenibacillus allorhizosphaerae]CAG7637892.1 Inositol 2-dehydrogenase/D-chiro-inositol 3-dehydrogenase [Paenibacillus allorhizosphaerae]